MKTFILSTLLILSLNAFAHEGAHGPAQKMAPHGGVLKDGKTLMAELVPDDNGVKVYFMSHDAKPISISTLKLEQKDFQLTDAKKKTVSFEFSAAENVITLKFDKSKSYRYNITTQATHNNGLNKLVWQFEAHSN